MTGRNYELPDNITTLGVMVIFELINWDIRGCTPAWLSYPQIIPSACANPFLRACAVVAVLKTAGKQCVRFCRSFEPVP